MQKILMVSAAALMHIITGLFYGTLYIPDVDLVPMLEEGSSGSAQMIVDANDRGCIQEIGNLQLITDHDVQGFSVIGELTAGQDVYLITGINEREVYEVAESVICTRAANVVFTEEGINYRITGETLVDWDGIPVLYDKERYDYTAALHTCYGSETEIVVFLLAKQLYIETIKRIHLVPNGL